MKTPTDYFDKKLIFPFVDWFRDITHTKLKLDGDQKDQANANLWSFSLNEEEKETIDLDDVIFFIKSIISTMRIKTTQLRDHNSILFYSWHDEMACTLRISFVCGRIYDSLPFRSKVKLADNVDQICSNFLTGKDHIPINEFEIDNENGVDPEEDTLLEVYAEQL